MNNTDKIFLQKTLLLEKKYLTLLLKVIKHFRSSFINDLTSQGKEHAVRQLHLTPYNDQLSPILQSIYRNAGLLGARMTTQEIKAQAKEKAANFGRNEAWINEVLSFLRFHMLKFVASISETMRSDIEKILEKGVEEGWSIDKTVDELQRLDLMRARARTIARTEIIRAANVGHSVGARSTPYEVDKKWSAARDHRTRHSHRKINGHTVGEDDAFKVEIFRSGKPTGTFDNMQYPGDATASPGNTINCRCRVTYIPKRDSQGRLIRRVATTATIIPMQPARTVVPAHQIAAALKANIFVGIAAEDETE